MLVYTPEAGVQALNGSGRAPARIGELVPEGQSCPRFGPPSVAVPGLPGAWELAAQRFASRPLAQLLEPAISYAADGFAVYPRLAHAIESLLAAPAASGPSPELGALLAENGREAGQTFRQPGLAASLRTLASEGAASFYEGALGARVISALAERGAVLSATDLAGHSCEWAEPLTANYRGLTVAGHPLISFSCLLLQELRILDGFELSGFEPNDPELIRLLVRCKESAFEDAGELGDPEFVPDQSAWTLSDERVAHWRDRVSPSPAAAGEGRVRVPSLLPAGADTTSLVVGDAQGNVACLIQSLFNEWGSREVAAGTGILMNDRLANMRADASAPNGLRGGKRPLHTLNTYMVLRDGQPILAGATPGGRGQVQINLQVLVNALDFGLNIQDAVDAPRWVNGAAYKGPGDRTLYLEPEVGAAEALRGSGEWPIEIVRSDESDMFGNCTVLARDPETGSLQAAADRRRYGAAVGW
ncbi:MAG: gamma-glutamyltransferase, partial [Chloroflexi bacterium]|nr:gamma-glutamyltransferase [Chloroflexota bacterium]